MSAWFFSRMIPTVIRHDCWNGGDHRRAAGACVKPSQRMLAPAFETLVKG
jgi:hypothetical protein